MGPSQSERARRRLCQSRRHRREGQALARALPRCHWDFVSFDDCGRRDLRRGCRALDRAGPPLRAGHRRACGRSEERRRRRRKNGWMKTLTLLLSLLVILGARPVLGAQAETWTVDPVHSTAQFTARHFGIVPVIGTIPIEKATVTLNAGSQIPIAVSAELDASKLDTHNDMRDGDLRSAHYFNVASTTEIRFVSTNVEGTDPKHFTIDGNLT